MENLIYNCTKLKKNIKNLKVKDIRMLITLIILLILFIITGVISGNFLFNLALNPQSSKSIFLNRTIDEDEIILREKNTDWINKNAEEVYIFNKKIKLCGYEIQNKKESKVWVIGAHGYTETACSMVGVAKQFLNYGYNVLLPDLRAHGKSEGKYIGMGWLDRLDLVKWINYLIEKYGHIKIILYGISMGAATVMMASGENLPSNVRVVIEDCGYTSVWDEFADKLKTIFHIPKFPAMYNANFMTKIRAGFSLKKASCVKQLKKCKIPTLFIHGDKDKFVPFYMLDKLYNTAVCKKEKLVIKNAGHADAQTIEPQKYWSTVRKFIKRYL